MLIFLSLHPMQGRILSARNLAPLKGELDSPAGRRLRGFKIFFNPFVKTFGFATSPDRGGKALRDTFLSLFRHFLRKCHLPLWEGCPLGKLCRGRPLRLRVFDKLCGKNAKKSGNRGKCLQFIYSLQRKTRYNKNIREVFFYVDTRKN